jgi:3-hydroxyisobutyrate dehydrogenase-like beta-hydroxyacid dehydrogenase
VGFLGFGEAGSGIATGLHAAGVRPVLAFDRLIDSEATSGLSRRATTAGAILVRSVAELAASARVVFSAVTPAAAEEAARSAAPHLTPQHIFVDLNSVAPSAKRHAEAAVSASGARYVDAAVMGAVPPLGHRVPILLAGPAASELIGLLEPYGMRLKVVGDQVGAASAVKMCRSVALKGVEALLLECLLAADRYSASEQVLESLEESFPGTGWVALADHLLARTAIHGERRGHELLHAAQTLSAVGVQPTLTSAAAARLLDTAKLGLRERFQEAPPKGYQSVIRALSEVGGR